MNLLDRFRLRSSQPKQAAEKYAPPARGVPRIGRGGGLRGWAEDCHDRGRRLSDAEVARLSVDKHDRVAGMLLKLIPARSRGPQTVLREMSMSLRRLSPRNSKGSRSSKSSKGISKSSKSAHVSEACSSVSSGAGRSAKASSPQETPSTAMSPIPAAQNPFTRCCAAPPVWSNPVQAAGDSKSRGVETMGVHWF